MNRAALFTRAAANALPEGSKERALATAGLRRWWHALFDPCPELSRRYGDGNRDFMDPFLESADRDRLAMDWTLHARLLTWMKETRPAELDAALAQELLAAAAARWANFDQSGARGALLYFTGMGGLGVAAWKPRSAEEDSRVVLIRLPPPASEPSGVFFADFESAQYPVKPDWRPLSD
ncbi:MAG: hypothetical protein ACHQ49_09225 [Elusimicrobiota bacterium]